MNDKGRAGEPETQPALITGLQGARRDHADIPRPVQPCKPFRVPVMARWFRFYSEVVNDPKVQKLPCEDFRAWVNLLCLASENDGRLPSIEDIAFALRMTTDGAATVVGRLANGGLIDRMSGGADGYHYAPHGWDKRQYKSDTSTERVKRFRERSVTVSETPPETDTESDTELKKEKVTPSPKKGSRLPVDWQPSEADLTFAASQNMTLEETNREADQFRDFWIAKPGAGGCKLDWPATWRTWCRNRRGAGQARKPNASGNGSKPVSMAGILAGRRRQAGSPDDVSAGGRVLFEDGGVSGVWTNPGEPEAGVGRGSGFDDETGGGKLRGMDSGTPRGNGTTG